MPAYGTAAPAMVVKPRTVAETLVVVVRRVAGERSGGSYCVILEDVFFTRVSARRLQKGQSTNFG